MLRKLRELSSLKRITVSAALILAGVAVAGAVTAPAPAPPSATSSPTTMLNDQQAGQVKGDATISPSQPTLSMRTVAETEVIPFQSTTQDDPNLPPGQKKILTQGANGVETVTYAITYTNGQQTSKILLSKAVTTPSIDQVVAVGTASNSQYNQQVRSPQCQPAQPPSGKLKVTITKIIAENAFQGFVYVQTQPCAALTLTITYCNGDQATSLSLYQPVTAYSSGEYAWPWIPNTRCRTAEADVTANWQGQSAEVKTSFTILHG